MSQKPPHIEITNPNKPWSPCSGKDCKHSSHRRPPLADVGAVGPVSGTNEKHPEGSYIRLFVNEKHYLISRGAAENLVAEINGILTTNPQGD